MITLISGRAGEGKSAFAHACQDVLVKEHNISSATIPFARMVKDTALFMGWDGEKDDKGRKLLQEIGNVGRAYDIDIWARHAAEFINSHPAEFEFVFIDDWRFPNEGKYIQEHFWPSQTVRIFRPKQFHALLNTPLYNDVSEISLPETLEYYDHIVDNSGTLNDLKESAKKFVADTLIPSRGK